MITFNKTN